jgi:hypothetical protein
LAGEDRITTSTCLDALDHRARRVLPTVPADPDPTADPADAVVRHEHIELAFIAAIRRGASRRRPR